MDNYQRWQLERYGNVLSEESSPLQVEDLENGFDAQESKRDYPATEQQGHY